MKRLNALLVIPARYGSSRFPAKPLANLNGKPIIQHVWERAMRARQPDSVVVATDDERIIKVVHSFGGKAVLTASTHRNGTERVAEVAAMFDDPVVVNLQGDLPVFRPEVLDKLIEQGRDILQKNAADMVTAQSAIALESEISSPHTVKVVSDHRNQALYFSRSAIPYRLYNLSVKVFKHYGIYIYSRMFLLKVAAAPEGVLEGAEQLEQLRVLEQGGRVHLIEISPQEASLFVEVNRPEDLEHAKAALAAEK